MRSLLPVFAALLPVPAAITFSMGVMRFIELFARGQFEPRAYQFVGLLVSLFAGVFLAPLAYTEVEDYQRRRVSGGGA